MAEKYQIAIIGSGPGGMSAAGRAAELGVPHILLERTDHLSDTIYKYQRGKHVMATPDILPLRSSMEFEPGTREAVLGSWDDTTEKLKVNVRYKAELTGLKGTKGDFTLTVNNKETIQAENVVLAIGLQGNLRKMAVEGADWERVQYQLDDPREYEDETIVVVGAGDAAIENAVALAEQNKVVIVNRRNEFARAKDGNVKLILGAIESEQVRCFYEANPHSIKPSELTLDTKGGQEIVKCDRIIARLGAIPPRKFVESCGIEFPSDDPTSLPELSPQYESNVPGLYIIGALGGYPLIKQAMNQGYEVVEFILGNDIKPADEPLLEQMFGPLMDRFTVDEVIDWIRQRIPLISGLTALQLREFLLDSTVHVMKQDDVVFDIGEFGTTVYMIAEGSVHVHVDPSDWSVVVPLESGTFFGELAMISVRPRTATVTAAEHSVIIETPRRTMIKVMNSVPSVEQQIHEAAMARQLRAYLSQEIAGDLMTSVIETAKDLNFKPGQALFQEGEKADGIFIIRKGSVTASHHIGDDEVMAAYIPAGQFIGAGSIVGGKPHYMTARATTQVSATWIEGKKFLEIMDAIPEFRRDVETRIVQQLIDNEVMTANRQGESLMQFLIDQGMGEATDILLIDDSLCVGCNNCEKACADTHGGVSRLDREAGPTFANVHVPTACRHCEDPYCMTDCPPNAIHRAPDGEVFIDNTCIGCGNCKDNCPYGVIKLAQIKPAGPSLLTRILFGAGDGNGKAPHKGGDGDSEARKFALKCDACKDIEGGASCVRACPTGAAFRVGPEEFFTVEKLAR